MYIKTENGKNSAGKILFILKTRLSYIANQRRGQQPIPRRRGEMRRTRLPREAGGAVFLRAARQARKRREKTEKTSPSNGRKKIENSANAILNRKKKPQAKRCGRLRRARAKALTVPGEGVEPSRCRHRRILSPLRLPIPPSGQIVYFKSICLFYSKLQNCRFLYFIPTFPIFSAKFGIFY